jgi:hypothetical protein
MKLASDSQPEGHRFESRRRDDEQDTLKSTARVARISIIGCCTYR